METKMYTEDYEDEISELIEEAYDIFNAITVSEVMDMDNRQSAVDFLRENYNNPASEDIERYLDVVERLEQVVDAG